MFSFCRSVERASKARAIGFEFSVGAAVVVTAAGGAAAVVPDCAVAKFCDSVA